jgi:hypothetical protein
MFHRRHVQPFTDPSGTDPGRAEPMPRALKDAYLLFLNRPPDDVPPGDGGATIVAARSLRHPELPQPTPCGCSTNSPASPPDMRARWCFYPI